ncbi:MAG: hypothetical protein GY810_26590 [Aureispira sp.]|nr:hypothetical protein [Aureispira sp.]
MPSPDIQLLENLLEAYLYKPNSKQSFVMVRVKKSDAWAYQSMVKRWGWLNESKTTVYFTDGESIEVSNCDTLAVLDFDRYCKGRTLAENTSDLMDLEAIGVFPPSDLVLAAWWHALDNTKMAQLLLAKEREGLREDANDQDMLSALKGQLAWSAYAGMIHNYMINKDTEAYAHGQRFQKLYNNYQKDYPQAKAILQELERRKTTGKFNSKAQPQAPDVAKDWLIDLKIDYLIDALDEIDVRQAGQPGGVPLGEDWRVQALIAIGDTAVPKLIDVIENDKRFTRSVHFWRDFSRYRTVLNVKEAALTAIMSIWQDPIFKPVATGDNFTSRGEAQAKALATQLREQRKKYVGKTLDFRKMEVLQDPKEKMSDRRRAAEDLANFGYRRVIGTTVWSGNWTKRYDGKNPLIEKWKSPTVAEAIWATMLEDLREFDEGEDFMYKEARRESRQQHYLSCFMELGDDRILPKLRKDYAQTIKVYEWRQLAYTCYWLGDTTLWDDYCTRLQQDKIELPKIEYSNGSISHSNPARQPGNKELRGILSCLTTINNPISKKTYQKITSSGHSYYPWIEKRLLQLTGGYDDDGNMKEIWYNKDFCLDIYKKNLDNTNNSDIQLKYYVGSGITSIMDWGGQSSFRLHELWDTSDYCNGEDVTLRARNCDMAASKLYQLIFGIPACHVHLKDKDERIARQKAFLDRFKTFRRLTSKEYNTVNELYAGVRYLPVIPTLNRPATAEDVKGGKALFELKGKGSLADIQLPATAIQKKDKGMEKPLRIYILQAEKNHKGKLVYGTLTEDGPKIFKEGDLINIKHLPKE